MPKTLTPVRNNQAFDEAMELVTQLKYQEASDRFTGVFPRLHATGDTAGAAEAMFWVGYCHEKQGQKTQAANWYKRVVRAYLWEPAASEAYKRLTRLSSVSDKRSP
jgi:TolA-binding protein